METTGIIRKIDDLGRIVIPREVRKRLEIREGQSMEILTDDEGRVILQKYRYKEEIYGKTGQQDDCISPPYPKAVQADREDG